MLARFALALLIVVHSVRAGNVHMSSQRSVGLLSKTRSRPSPSQDDDLTSWDAWARAFTQDESRPVEPKDHKQQGQATSLEQEHSGPASDFINLALKSSGRETLSSSTQPQEVSAHGQQTDRASPIVSHVHQHITTDANHRAVIPVLERVGHEGPPSEDSEEEEVPSFGQEERIVQKGTYSSPHNLSLGHSGLILSAFVVVLTLLVVVIVVSWRGPLHEGVGLFGFEGGKKIAMPFSKRDVGLKAQVPAKSPAPISTPKALPQKNREDTRQLSATPPTSEDQRGKTRAQVPPLIKQTPAMMYGGLDAAHDVAYGLARAPVQTQNAVVS